mgnify:CR=1 FL=1
MSYIRGTKVIWEGDKLEKGIIENKIYEVDNFVDLRDRHVRVSNKTIVQGEYLIQLKLEGDSKSDYLNAFDFKIVE